MSNDIPASTHHTSRLAAGVDAARAQIDAARSRQEQLRASGQLRGAADDDMPAHRALPGYTLLRELHRGGQGVVHLAIQNSTGRQVAIKVLKRDLPLSSDAAALMRFEREIEILSRLKHPNIVTVHDCGRDHGRVFLVMDYVDGRSLDTWIDREKSAARPLDQTLDLFARICDGVNAAHLRGVIHRDLKPGNILVDERGEPHVLDFGLAKFEQGSAIGGVPSRDPTMTITGQFVGSLPWASPEQAEGRVDALDVRTDVYSLGVLLYQVLTGRFPYPVAGRLSDVVRNIVESEPIRPSTIERRIDRELETIVLKCLAKEPARRYQNAGDIARDIRRYLAGEAIEARRDSLGYIMSKRLARYRAAVIAAAAILAVVLCALAVSIAFWGQAATQRTLAQGNAMAALQAAEQAARDAAEARAVTDFMRGVLSSVEPENQGADVRLIEVIEKASAEASKRFAGHPRREAEVREIFGQVYDRLSLWSAAKAEVARAAELWLAAAGPDDARTLATQSRLVHEALNMAQPAEAERVLADLVPRLERVCGRDDPLTLGAYRDVAMTHLLRGRVQEAQRLLLELRAHPRLADDQEQQIRIVSGLIAVHTAHPEAGDEAGRLKHLRLAEPLALEWVDRSTRLLGPTSIITLQAELKWAEIVCELGRYRAAAEMARRVLETPAGRLGECHHIRQNAMYILAEALTGLGDDLEPARLHVQRVECMRRQMTSESVAFVAGISDALRFIERGGLAAEGEALARELLASLARMGGGHDNMEMVTEMFVANFVSMQNRLDEAERMIQALLARESDLGDAAQARARLHLYYGNHLTRRGEFEQAEAQLNTARDLLGDVRRGTWGTHPDDLVLGYMALYQAWDKPDRLAEYEQVRQEIQRTLASVERQ
jgi:tetratricopeptide (TPR) repeat protein/predicted Ser/Thr protein kinase